MAGLSLRELAEGAGSPHPYIPTKINEAYHAESKRGIWEIIHRGAMPELQGPDVSWDSFYSSYMSAHLERDVRDILNASDIGDAIDCDHKTVVSWLSILQTSGIIRIIEPFWSNVDKRITKTPKVYFMDTGLVCHLTRWTTPEQLRNGAAAGHVLETFVVSEVLKSYMNAGANVRDVWFYRDARKREIDLVIQEVHVLHPVEVKTAATVGPGDVRNFGTLEGFRDYEVGFGHVICQTPEPYMIARDVKAVPVWDI